MFHGNGRTAASFSQPRGAPNSATGAMAYRPNPIGAELHYGDPEKALRKLEALYARYGTRAKVAKAAGVDEATLGRWLRRLRVNGMVVKGAVERSGG